MSAEKKPTVPDVLPLVWSVYARHGAGCCLHIVLGDGNVRDSDVEYCRQVAVDAGHKECEELATLLLDMSKTQRKKLSRQC